ncbi:MAG: arsenic metallochaperone ArsD family protein [Methanocella sp.]
MTRKELTIFEGPVCCPTGVCGPTADKEMIELNETLKRLGDEYKGIKITRASMSFNVALFMQTPLIRDLVKENGVSILPVTVIDGKVHKKQGYPKYAELTQWLGPEG